MKIPGYIAPLLFAFLSFLIYSNVLHGPFILDDEIFILTNNQIRDISNFLKDFSGTRYIGFLSFAVNYYFGGLNTFGYHVVNIVIHILNAILVYILIQAMCNRLEAIGKPIAHSPLPIAFFVSLIFLVHPIQTQAVSYITQRFTSLAALFYLVALVLYVKARLKGEKEFYLFTSLPFYLLSLIFTVLAMKTKELSFTLPFIIILCEWTFFREEPPLPSSTGFQPVETGKMPVPPERAGVKGKRLLYLLPFVLTLVIIPLDLFFMRANPSAERMLQDTLQRDISVNPLSYASILTQFNVMATYIRLLFIPVNQNLWYDYPISHSIFEIQTFSSLFLLISIFIGTIYLYFKARKANNVYGLLISFGVFWFFITLSVVSIMPLSGVIFEHWLYLPSIGFILSIITIILYGFDCLEGRTEKPLYNYIVLIIIAAAAVFSFVAYKRNILWADNYKMWLDVVKKSPTNAMAHMNLGVAYYDLNQMDESIKEYKNALILKPYFAEAHYNLGLVYSIQGRLDEAIAEYRISLKLKPADADAHYNLGNAYKLKGLKNEARREFEIALKLKPDHPLAHQSIESLGN